MGRYRLEQPRSRVSAYWLAALLAIALGTVLLTVHPAYLRAEALVAGKILDILMSWKVGGGGPVIWYGIGTGELRGLYITLQCSTLVLWLCVLAVYVVLMASQRVPFGRALFSLSLACLFTACANVIRYGAAMYARHYWGQVGFESVHYWYGSLFVLIMTVIASLFMLWFATRDPAAKRAKKGKA